MEESFEISTILPASAENIFHAWLDSEEHAAFTGSSAQIDPHVGGLFTAWDGYIQGKTLELEPSYRIVQAWRTTEFPENCPDSRLEVLLDEVDGGTKVILRHTGIPEGQGESYKEGWEDYYFKPMRDYLEKRGN